MAISFQYNKTAQQTLEKQLKVRERALPTLKNKESALRVEVKRAKDRSQELDGLLSSKLIQYDTMMRLWNEFDSSLVRVKDVAMSMKKIAGVKTPVLENIEFEIASFSLFNAPVWVPEGVAIIKELAQIGIEKEVYYQKMRLLDSARKKTTQKVNLYEKVQIPGYQDAILKIKRFMEDEENLSKSAQKIVKNRQQQMEAQP
jgi:V/A-type H+/Na+-transporting ATPase subunit D